MEHNYWVPCKKATYLMTIFSDPAAHIVHDVPTGVIYEEVTEVFQNCHSDHHLAAVFHSQLKRRTQLSGESPQEFAAAMDHLAYGSHIVLPEHLISKEAACSCANEIRE